MARKPRHRALHTAPSPWPARCASAASLAPAAAPAPPTHPPPRSHLSVGPVCAPSLPASRMEQAVSPGATASHSSLQFPLPARLPHNERPTRTGTCFYPGRWGAGRRPPRLHAVSVSAALCPPASHGAQWKTSGSRGVPSYRRGRRRCPRRSSSLPAALGCSCRAALPLLLRASSWEPIRKSAFALTSTLPLWKTHALLWPISSWYGSSSDHLRGQGASSPLPR